MASEESGEVFEVQVLGPLVIKRNEQRLEIGGPKPSLLVAILIATANEVVSVDALIDGLWGEEPPATAKKAVQVNVSLARKSLGSDFPLLTEGRGYLIKGTNLVVDERYFSNEVETAAGLIDTDPVRAVEVLSGALARWNGSAYADFHESAALQGRIVQLGEQRLRASTLLFEARLSLGQHDDVIGDLDALATEHPYREEFRRLHMLALYRAGRQTDALRAFDRTRDLLLDELGLEPSGDLRQMQHQILDQAEALDLPGWGTSEVVNVGVERTTGHTVRGYELRQRLGESVDSTRFRAYQSSVGREVEITVIRPEAANRSHFVKRFQAEAQHVAKLEHPHIVPLYDYWRDPGGAYVVSQSLQAGSLADALGQRSLQAPAAIRLLGQIGDALSYAHRQGVVHGAVNGDNVLLDDDGNAYLSGFNIAQVGDTEVKTMESEDLVALARLADDLLIGRDLEFGKDRQDVGQPERLAPEGLDELLSKATGPDREARFDRVDDFLRALRQLFGVDVAVSEVAPADVRNPFKGLRAFVETDAADFFGREAMVSTVLEQVSAHQLTAIVGPSGCGKSSLVKAGLLPAVREGGFGRGRSVVITEMFPGSYPFEELEAALMRVAVDRPTGLLQDLLADERGLLRVSKQILPDDDTDLLLVIDQFEELFTLTQDEHARRSFLQNLVAIGADERSRIRVVVTLRADFFDKPLSHPEFGELMSAGLVPLAMPSGDELARAISAPARAAGLEIEGGLVSLVARDVTGEPGALPLMQYALTELVTGRDGQELTIAAYERTGGVVGALTRRAEDIFNGLPPAAQQVAEELFVHLVSVDEDTDDTRRRVRRTDLEALGLNGAAVETVIADYGSFRLLSFDHDPVTRGQTIEVAHEALIREWPRFRAWIDERREMLVLRRRLQAAVGEWEANGRDASFLFSGGRLQQYEAWASSSATRIGQSEQRFLDESRRAETEELRKAARARRSVLVLVSGLAAIASVVAVVAYVQQRRAVASTDRAEQAALISQAAAVSAEDPELSLLLALEAHRRAPGPESEQSILNALVNTTFANQVASRPLFPGECAGFSLFWTQEYGRQEWDTIDGRMLSRDTLTGEVIDHGPPPIDCAVGYIEPDSGVAMAVGNGGMSHWVGAGFETEISFDAVTFPLWVTEDRYFVVDFENGMNSVSMFDVDSGVRVGEIVSNEILLSTAVTADGRLAAFSFVNPLAPEGDGRLVVVDAETGDVTWQEDFADGITALRFDDRTGELIASYLGGEIWTIDPVAREVTSTVTTEAFEIRALGFRSDGSIVAVDSGSIQVVDRLSGPTGLRVELQDAVEPRVRPDGSVVLVQPSGTVDVFDVDGSAVAEQVWQVPPTGEISLGAGQAAITDGPPAYTTVVDLVSGQTADVAYQLPDGEPFDARSVFSTSSGLWAVDIDMLATYWEDGILVEQIDLGSDPSVSGIRVGTRNAGIKRLDDRYGVIGVRGGGVWEASLARLETGEAELLFTVALPASVEILDVHPAADGGLHVLGSDDLLVTYNSEGMLVSEIDTNPDGVIFDIDGNPRFAQLAVDPASGKVAIADFAGQLTIIEPATGRLIFPTGFGEAEALGFIRNGQYLAIVGRSGSVRLWDVDREAIAGLFFDGNGSSGGEAPWYDEATDSVWVNASGQVIRLPLDPERWVERACDIVTRELTPDEWARFVPGEAMVKSPCS